MPSDQLKIEKSLDPQTNVETLRMDGPMTLATLFEFQAALRDVTAPENDRRFERCQLHGFGGAWRTA